MLCCSVTQSNHDPRCVRRDIVVKEGDAADRLFIITRGVLACEGVVYTK